MVLRTNAKSEPHFEPQCIRFLSSVSMGRASWPKAETALGWAELLDQNDPCVFIPATKANARKIWEKLVRTPEQIKEKVESDVSHCQFFLFTDFSVAICWARLTSGGRQNLYKGLYIYTHTHLKALFNVLPCPGFVADWLSIAFWSYAWSPGVGRFSSEKQRVQKELVFWRCVWVATHTHTFWKTSVTAVHWEDISVPCLDRERAELKSRKEAPKAYYET